MNKWFIGIKKRTEDIFDVSDMTILESPIGHYWADPFLADEDGITYLFFEDYNYDKGVIAVGELHGLEIRNIRTVIDEPKHLSFPSVFKDGGDWYMTPERCLSGELSIYKATAFPDVWEPIVTVSRGRYDDPILRKKENGYQIWTVEDGDKVRVFESKTIDGEWRLIKSNDEQYARPAGHFIGDIRPVQDSVPTYGRALKFKRGDAIIKEIEPDWIPNLTGTHTFNISEKYVCIDGRIKLHD